MSQGGVVGYREAMDSTLEVCVIIPAAGSGTRYAAGLEVPRSKLEEDLGGRPLLHRTIELFTNYEQPDVSIHSIIVAGPHDPAQMEAFRTRHGDKLGLLGAKLVPGGKTHRYETVHAALAHVPDACTHVAVHDAARPCTSRDLLDRLFGAAMKFAAVVPGMEIADTVKRIGPDEIGDPDPDPLASILGEGVRGPTYRAVEGTLDRKGLYTVQTPQVFEASLLKRAYGQSDLSSTDDAGLVERLGERVIVVPGEARNIKVTRPEDVHLARAIMGVHGPAERAAHKKF